MRRSLTPARDLVRQLPRSNQLNLLADHFARNIDTIEMFRN